MIGVFDSGLGGLSVLAALVQTLPSEDFCYVADSAYCPYGGRRAEEIIARSRVLTDALLQKGAALIVVACNTATIAAIQTLREEYPLSFVGMEPAVKPAAKTTQTGVVGVLATGAALSGDKLHRLIATHGQGVRVLTQPCPGWVECVERGELDGPVVEALVAERVKPLVAAGADVLVLGCTHYPFLRPVIQRVAGLTVQLIDTGAAVARRTQQLLLADGLVSAAHTTGSIRCFTTGSSDIAKNASRALWPQPLTWEALA